MDQPGRPLSAEFWSAPAVAKALATCDFATLLEEIRRARGWTQKQLASAAGYSQSWVSNVLRGQQALTVDQVRDLSRRIGVPVHLLRFGDPGGDEPTKRRDFGMATALALVPLPARTTVDEATAAFRLARNALDLGVTYSSTRVVERARRFRRDNPGPPTTCVREFDDRLRAALA